MAATGLPAQSLEDYIDFSTDNLPGRLFIPTPESRSAEQVPLIIALHGGGAIGNNNIGNIWDFDSLLAIAKTRGAFIYAPQATSAFWHANSRPAAIMDQVDRLIAEFRIDPRRVIVTGFSMGGGGAWHLGSVYAERIAGVLPICGITPGADYAASALAGKPVWAFHARNDTVVSVNRSRDRIDELLALAARPDLSPPTSGNFEFADADLSLSYTEWETGGHFIWDRVYEDPRVADWIFDQALAGTPPALKIMAHPQSRTLAAGQRLELSTTVTEGVTATYQWTKDGQPIALATAANLVIESIEPNDAGLYRVQVATNTTPLVSRPAKVAVESSRPGFVSNLSVRAALKAATGPLIVGFVAQGEPHPQLVRAVGPSLGGFGVVDALPDPQVELHTLEGGPDSLLAENQDWSGSSEVIDLSATAGAFPLTDTSSADAALVWHGTGVVTAHITDRSAESGTVLVELYAPSRGVDNPLVNVSARHRMSSPEEVLIAGFVIEGTVPQPVLVRAVGQGLVRAGVANPMPDPHLRLFLNHEGDNILFAENTVWTTEANAEHMAGAVPGAFPLEAGGDGAALLLRLPAGVYTLHASSMSGATGDVLVEVYSGADI